MGISPGTRRVFLIEPDGRSRDRVEAILQGAGYDVTAPPGPGFPTDQLGRRQYDATIAALEWTRPDPARAIRELKRLGGAPVFVLCEPQEVRTAVRLLREGAEDYLLDRFPQLRDPRYPALPRELAFVHAEDMLEMYPDLPRKERETRLLKECPAVFIYGIGWPLADGYPHELRAADYDDWVSETESKDGRPMHGLNGDILVYNPVTRRRHELSSMGIRVTAQTLLTQLEMSGQMELAEQPYHQAILQDRIPLSIGGGIGQSRLYMLLLRKAHLGEVGITVWPKELKRICEERNIHVLQ